MIDFVADEAGNCASVGRDPDRAVSVLVLYLDGDGSRFALALALGLRQGEALSLQWEDLGETDKTLTIRQAIQRHTWRHGCGGDCGKKRGTDCPRRYGGGLAVVPTKSKAGKRTIGVPAELYATLIAHQELQAAEKRTAANLWSEDGWMFAQPTGKPVDPRADFEEWRTLLREAGVRPARLHDARHTAATILLVLKVPTRTAMDVMGWSQASMATRYQHVPVEVLTDIAAQVAGLLWKSKPEDDDGAQGSPATA